MLYIKLLYSLIFQDFNILWNRRTRTYLLQLYKILNTLRIIYFKLFTILDYHWLTQHQYVWTCHESLAQLVILSSKPSSNTEISVFITINSMCSVLLVFIVLIAKESIKILTFLLFTNIAYVALTSCDYFVSRSYIQWLYTYRIL